MGENSHISRRREGSPVIDPNMRPAFDPSKFAQVLVVLQKWPNGSFGALFASEGLTCDLWLGNENLFQCSAMLSIIINNFEAINFDLKSSIAFKLDLKVNCFHLNRPQLMWRTVKTTIALKKVSRKDIADGHCSHDSTPLKTYHLRQTIDDMARVSAQSVSRPPLPLPPQYRPLPVS